MNESRKLEINNTIFEIDDLTGEHLIVTAGIFIRRGLDVLFSEPNLYGYVSIYLDGNYLASLKEHECKLIKAFIKQQRAINKELLCEGVA